MRQKIGESFTGILYVILSRSAYVQTWLENDMVKLNTDPKVHDANLQYG